MRFYYIVHIWLKTFYHLHRFKIVTVIQVWVQKKNMRLQVKVKFNIPGNRQLFYLRGQPCFLTKL